MKTKERTIWIMAPVLAISIGFLVPNATAQSDPYPKMAPVDHYLMEKNAEIQLARSAAPDSISRDATILVLGRQGYAIELRYFGIMLNVLDWNESALQFFQAAGASVLQDRKTLCLTGCRTATSWQSEKGICCRQS